MTPLALGAFAASVTLLAVPTLTEPTLTEPTLTEPTLTEPTLPASTGSSPPRARAIESAPPQQGRWPVPPTAIVTGFDDPQPYAAGHRGIDLAATVGQVVIAAQPGTVSVAGPVAGRPVVVLRHAGGTRTSYLPVIPLVRVGDRVQAGDPIGTVAEFGHCLSTTCLHWGARRGDRYIDPLTLLSPTAGLIVLLPDEPDVSLDHYTSYPRERIGS